MSKGKIKNFVLAGDALSLTAMVDKDGCTCYHLNTSLAFGETLTYEGLVLMLEVLKSDIEDVLKFGTTYVEDEDGHFVANGNGARNEFIEKFEDMWHGEA